MDEVDKIINQLIKEKGGSREDYLHLMNTIAYHESSHTMDPSIVQKSNNKSGIGPGRGKYQFEVGKNAGGITAARRARQYYEQKNIPLPEWLIDSTAKEDLDVTELTSEQQDILFLANMRQHPKADFSKVWNKEESLPDFWANYHWAGEDVHRPARLKSFNSSLNDYNIKKQNNSLPNPTSKEDVNNSSKSIFKNFNKSEQRVIEQDGTRVQQPKVLNQPNNMNFIVEEGLKMAMGGMSPSNSIPSMHNKVFNSFNEGGLHENNPYGGIPQGTGSNGKMNTVEEGESSFNFEDGKYIFSNRLNGSSSLNQYMDGGLVSNLNMTDPKNKTLVGPQPPDKKLEFTKTEKQGTYSGGVKNVSETYEVPNVREQHMYPNFLSSNPLPSSVNFNQIAKTDGAKAFINRYDNEWSRNTLMEQNPGITNEDLDNMYLKGAMVNKKHGAKIPNDAKGYYNPEDEFIALNENSKNDIGVEVHERTHASMIDVMQGDNLKKVLGSAFQQEDREGFKKMDPNTVRNLNKPHEAYGNFAEFREKLGLNPGEQISKEELKKRIKKLGLESENFYRTYNDENIIKALNTIAQNSKGERNNLRLS